MLHALPQSLLKRCLVTALLTLLAPVSIPALAQERNTTAQAIWPSAPRQSGDCLSNAKHTTAIVDRITDGDTIVLEDGQRVRLIGFNTPELRRRGFGKVPYAQAATTTLKSLIPPGTTIKLYPGKDAKDRNGRLLAHAEREDGSRPAETLLRQGLAAAVGVAPNTRCLAAFVQFEQQARANKIGLWQQQAHWSKQASELNADNNGFYLVTGSVTNVANNDRGSVITLDKKFDVHIRASLAKQLPINSLTAARIEARGWLWKKNGKPVLRLHHPLNIRVLSTP